MRKKSYALCDIRHIVSPVSRANQDFQAISQLERMVNRSLEHKGRGCFRGKGPVQLVRHFFVVFQDFPTVLLHSVELSSHATPDSEGDLALLKRVDGSRQL